MSLSVGSASPETPAEERTQAPATRTADTPFVLLAAPGQHQQLQMAASGNRSLPEAGRDSRTAEEERGVVVSPACGSVRSAACENPAVDWSGLPEEELGSVGGAASLEGVDDVASDDVPENYFVDLPEDWEDQMTLPEINDFDLVALCDATIRTSDLDLTTVCETEPGVHTSTSTSTTTTAAAAATTITTTTTASLLRRCVLAQQRQILLLRSCVSDMARRFGRQERILLAQVKALTQQLSGALQHQVNGQDVSRASHEDAVRAFQAAREPIVVEVLRRSSASIRSDANLNPRHDTLLVEAESVTAATQTDSWPEFPPPPPFEDDDDDAEDADQDDDDPGFGDVGDHQLDFEEVTLTRSLVSDRLGLTLYYPDGHEADEETDVIVRSVDPGGLAARDGRLQPGDQVVQINGEDVCGKEQAERLLAIRPNVTLLVCRPAQQVEDECDSEGDAGAEELHNTPRIVYGQAPLDNRVADNMSAAVSAVGRDSQEKRDTMKSNSTTSSSSANSGSSESGSSPDDRQGRGDLSIDGEMQLVHRQMASIKRECASLARRQRAGHRRRVEDHIYETIPEGGESDEPLYCQPYEAGELGRPEPPAGRPSCQLPGWGRAADAWHLKASSTSDSRSSGDSGPGEKRLEAGREPLALELTVLGGEARRESALTLPAHEPAPRSSRPGEPGEHPCRHCRQRTRPPKNKNVINSANAVEKNRNYVTILAQGTSYTSAARLEETIHQQQRQLYQQLLRHGQSRVPAAGQPPAAAPFSGCLNQYRFVSSPGGSPRRPSLTQPTDQAADEPVQFQYRVKVRSDGSRYIARRPLRRQLLKERAARIAEQRAGVTTDDDAVSELKLGKYWPREEKKRQLEHAKEKKLKLQQRTKISAVPEESTQDELSLRKRQFLQNNMNSSLVKKPPTPSRRKAQPENGFLHTKPLKNTDIVLSVTTV